jgi:hypothetical protein
MVFASASNLPVHTDTLRYSCCEHSSTEGYARVQPPTQRQKVLCIDALLLFVAVDVQIYSAAGWGGAPTVCAQGEHAHACSTRRKLLLKH